MLRKIKAKQGVTKIVIAIFSMLFLLFIFIVFIFLFSLAAKSKGAKIDEKISSVNTEYLLKTFLRSPPYWEDMRENRPKDLFPAIGGSVTNADLISWTCNNDNDQNYRALKKSASAFFDQGYKNDWNLWVEYSDEKIDKKNLGHKNLLEKIGNVALAVISLPVPIGTAALTYRFVTHYRERGFASQIIPCSSGGLAQVKLKTSADKFNIKSFKDTDFED